MAAPTYPQTNVPHVAHKPMEWSVFRAKASIWAVPVGRTLFALIFVISAWGHFTQALIDHAAMEGVLWPNFLVPASGVLALAGGLSILFGYHARIGALLILAFLLPVTFAMHDFWNYPEAMAQANQLAHFLKNVSMMGGALYLAFYGAGPVSVDHNAKA